MTLTYTPFGVKCKILYTNYLLCKIGYLSRPNYSFCHQTTKTICIPYSVLLLLYKLGIDFGRLLNIYALLSSAHFELSSFKHSLTFSMGYKRKQHPIMGSNKRQHSALFATNFWLSDYRNYIPYSILLLLYKLGIDFGKLLNRKSLAFSMGFKRKQHLIVGSNKRYHSAEGPQVFIKRR